LNVFSVNLRRPSAATWVSRAAYSSVFAMLGISTVASVAAEQIVDFHVLRADTLIGLSKSILNSPDAWHEVARINKLPDANRIAPGQILRIPARLLRADAVGATVVSVTGDVQANGIPAQAGATLSEGQSLQTGSGGSAVVLLADGSRVQIAPSSLAEVAASRKFGARLPAAATASAEDVAAAGTSDGLFAGTMRLLRGSVEVFATKVLRAKPLEVVTPTAVVGVRGTHYRVGFDEAVSDRTHAELLEGAVRFDIVGAGSGADLTPGFGASTTAAGAAPFAVAKLLDPPDLSNLPQLFERPIVRFTMSDETTPVRVQVASDSAFERMVSDQVAAPGGEIRISGLDDSEWFIRARRIDAQGIEGKDSRRTFALKARPEPPAMHAPRADAKVTAGRIEFAWAPNVDAQSARLQIAEDADFKRIVQDRDSLADATLGVDVSSPGIYYWRLASVRPSGDHGPFGDAQRFEVRTLPPPPSVGRSADGGALVFQWNGRPGDRQQVQLAGDTAFKDVIEQAELSGTEWTLAMPSRGGRYYFRYRSVEPDGYISPYSETLLIDVPHDWSPLGLLLPFLLLF